MSDDILESGGAESSKEPGCDTSCGFVSIMGLPNAGKSTLLNTVIGQKISIVSRKVQTTRARVLGIISEGKAQIIFVDTPGVFRPQKTLEKVMVDAALDGMRDSDVVLHLVDAAKKDVLRHNQDLIDQLPAGKPCYLLLNKVDMARRVDLLPLAAGFNEVFSYEKTFMVSAQTSSGLDDVVAELSAHLPAGPWLFPEDQMTDVPMRLLAAELTREKIFDRLHQELPYSIFVETQSWENFDNGDVKISQVIYVQRSSQKSIVLGKGGRQIKEIGQQTREELEQMLDGRVHLNLFVKVQENWTERSENYRLMGLDV